MSILIYQHHQRNRSCNGSRKNTDIFIISFTIFIVFVSIICAVNIEHYDLKINNKKFFIDFDPKTRVITIKDISQKAENVCLPVGQHHIYNDWKVLYKSIDNQRKYVHHGIIRRHIVTIVIKNTKTCETIHKKFDF